mmetsp:Transcript_118680/g.335692  ORF Transcript_118680/g.335692 Transcript_118680/m.335692 type:complete len:1002 (+) Transcript_118680:208-3213(+)
MLIQMEPCSDEDGETSPINHTSEGLTRKTKKVRRTVEHKSHIRVKAQCDPDVPAHRRPRRKDKATEDFIKAGMKANRFCCVMEDSEMEAIVNVMEYYEYEVGETIVKQGNVGQYFFVAQEGVLEVFIDGVFVNAMGPGTAFGAIALVYDCPRTATVIAKDQKAGVWGADGDVFRNVLQEHAHKTCEVNRQLLNQMCLFDGLSAKNKELVGELALIEESFEVGRRVVTEGEVPKAVYFVKEGRLSFMAGGCFQTSGALEGAENIGCLKKGDCFGWRAVLYGERHQASVVADTHCDLVCVTVRQLAQVLGPDFAKGLELGFQLSVIRRMPAFSSLPKHQLQCIVEELETRSFGASERTPDGKVVSIVEDGDVIGSMGGMTLTLKRGQCCQDATLAEISSNEAQSESRQGSVMGEAGLPILASPREAVPCVQRLVAGPKGCRLATLSAEGLARALTNSGTASATDDVLAYLRKVMILRRVPILREVSDEQVDRLVASLALRRYVLGDKVFTQGEIGNAFFAVASGEVAVICDGNRVRTLGQNAAFGERAVLFNERRSATVEVASSQAELWTVDRTVFCGIVGKCMLEMLARNIQLQDKRLTLKQIKPVRLIGSGSFGTVRMVENRRTGLRYALKRIRKKSGEVPKEVQQECELLGEIRHPSIMRMVNTFETASSIYILTELITGGQMYEQVLEKLGVLSRKNAQFYVASLVLILEALHERHIVYRDLKPENVMLDGQGYLKLVDFGLAKKLDEETARTYTLVGTVYYMAPEVVRGRGYGFECDIWSLGVMFFELVCGYLPFGADLDNDHEILLEILSNDVVFPSKYTDSAGKKLIKALLEKDDGKRLGVAGCSGLEDVKANRFFKAGFSGNIFTAIAGRELKPPLEPSGEWYSSEEAIKKKCSLSDDGEFCEEDPLDVGCRVLHTFKKFDLNLDGWIDSEELSQVLRALDGEAFTDEVINTIMKSADTDHDGRIAYEEFVDWVFCNGEGDLLARFQAATQLDVH